jgi:hypothetical protein
MTAKETYDLNKRARLLEKNQMRCTNAMSNPETEGTNNNRPVI